MIAASPLGKLKTAFQVAMVMALIAVHGATRCGSTLLVYVTVAVTVLSGADYFFGLRRHLGAAPRAASAAPAVRRRRPSQATGVSSQARSGSCGAATCSPVASSRAHLAERAEALGDDVVLVDRLEVLLAGRDEARGRRGREGVDDAARPSRARSPRRSAGGGAPSRPRAPRRSASSARRSPRTSSSRRWRSSVRGVDLVVARLGAADVQRAEAALVVRGDGDGSKIARSRRREAVGLEPLARGAGDQLLRARARGHALGGRRRSAGACRVAMRPPSRSSV